MTRADEIAEIRRVMTNVQLFREIIATQAEGRRKTEILETADAVIEKARMHLAALESSDGSAPVILSIPAALQ